VGETLHCPGCGARTGEAVSCVRCGSSPLLGGRYRLVRLIARDEARGTETWEVVREADGARFAAWRGPPGARTHEDQALMQITHPRLAPIVEVMAVGEAPGHRSPACWRLQEWVDGPDLQDGLASRLSEDDVLQVLEEVGEALEHLHGLAPPLVHGDLKPTNVRRTATGAVLVDFGARTGRGAPFEAPELRAGRPPTPRSDLYALGVTAVALLTGEPPARLIGADHRVRWRGKASVRAETRRLIDALVDPDPGERPASARVVREQIRAILDGEWATVPVRPVRSVAPLPHGRDVGWVAVGALSVAGMHLTAGSLLALAALTIDRLAVATEWPQRIGAAWLAALPLSQLLYVGPAFGLAWRAHRPLAQGVALGGALSVALHLIAAIAALVGP
jgi:hypothetical protein